MSTLYRFRIELSDVDRGVYELLDFRVAMHPSESTLYLMTKILAYALNFQEGLEFTPGGLGDPDQPCLRISSENNSTRLWIEIGNTGVRKLHKAAKAAQCVKVYTYKDAEMLLAEIRANDVHHASRIEIYSLVPEFLERLAKSLQKDNKWSLVHTDGSVMIGIGEASEMGELKSHSI